MTMFVVIFSFSFIGCDSATLTGFEEETIELSIPEVSVEEVEVSRARLSDWALENVPGLQSALVSLPAAKSASTSFLTLHLVPSPSGTVRYIFVVHIDGYVWDIKMYEIADDGSEMIGDLDPRGYFKKSLREVSGDVPFENYSVTFRMEDQVSGSVNFRGYEDDGQLYAVLPKGVELDWTLKAGAFMFRGTLDNNGVSLQVNLNLGSSLSTRFKVTHDWLWETFSLGPNVEAAVFVDIHSAEDVHIGQMDFSTSPGNKVDDTTALGEEPGYIQIYLTPYVGNLEQPMLYAAFCSFSTGIEIGGDGIPEVSPVGGCKG